MNTFKNRTTAILMTIILLCIVDVIIIEIYAVSKYSWLFLLPMSFMFLSMFFLKEINLIGRSTSATIFILLLAVKNLVIPLFMALGDGSFNSVVETEKYLLMAILLEIYEELVVFILLKIYYKRLRYTNINNQKIKVDKRHIKTLTIFTLLILVIVVLIFTKYPQLIAYVSLGISGDKDQIVQEAILKQQMKNSVPSLFYYSYTYFVNLLRWAIPIVVIFREYVNTKHSEFRKIIISFFVIIFSALLTIDTVAVSLFIFVALSLVLMRLYYNKRTLIRNILISTVVVVGVFSLALKSFGNDNILTASFSDLSRLFQAYFSGPENVAVALAIDNHVSLNELIGSVFRFIPYIMYYFKDFISTNVIFNQVYWGKSGIETQIIPVISQGARYFSVLFAPVFTIIIGTITIRQEIYTRVKNNIFSYTTGMVWCVCFSLALFMYSASLCIQLFINYILPIIIFSWLSQKITIGDERNERR